MLVYVAFFLQAIGDPKRLTTARIAIVAWENDALSDYMIAVVAHGDYRPVGVRSCWDSGMGFGRYASIRAVRDGRMRTKSVPSTRHMLFWEGKASGTESAPASRSV